ncbi:MAG TPA: sigma-70 family RNA polymerase sigma factor [Gammaproteobacteria bacterium]|nr:sigma-70 family RNA polymerase sigma factor [Gammaproteobacteria bacterium]
MDEREAEAQEAGAREEKLWADFIHDRSDENRNELAGFYLPFARMLAASLYAGRTVQEVEFVDYYQNAVIGLLTAIDRYDPQRGIDFKAYARHRIRGAILTAADGLTERSEQIAFRREVARERIRSISGPLVGAAQGDSFQEMVDVAIGLAIGFLLQDSGMYRADESLSVDSYSGEEMDVVSERIQEALAVLTDRERAVIEYHYMHDLRFTVVAERLQLTRGRVSQLHASALRKLREAYLEADTVDLKF